ncbi:MAG TPA: 2'-5' RNA ligase family protein [Chthoniobacterales bacterium]|nr:2'-5' RNA ligase family protein [Chthoniobacterales bacterium]
MRIDRPDAFLAYWLMPAEPTKGLLASMIANLAARFDAPLFEPHVTVYATKEANFEALSDAVAVYEPFLLTVRDIQCSDEFTKTLFARFGPSKALSLLSDELKQASGSHDEYQLNPHLSLIYKEMTPGARAELAASIQLPFTEVTFDCAKAVLCPRAVTSGKDVEDWRVVATQRMTK